MLKPSQSAKYAEKAKELDRQWKAGHRKLLLILLIAIVIIAGAAVIFCLIFPDQKGTIILIGLLALSALVTYLNRKKNENTRYYNRQILLLEKLETEEEMKNWDQNHPESKL